MGYPEVVDRLAILNASHPRWLNEGMRTPTNQHRRLCYFVFFVQLPALAERIVRARHWRFSRRYQRDARPPCICRRYRTSSPPPHWGPSSSRSSRASRRSCGVRTNCAAGGFGVSKRHRRPPRCFSDSDHDRACHQRRPLMAILGGCDGASGRAQVLHVSDGVDHGLGLIHHGKHAACHPARPRHQFTGAGARSFKRSEERHEPRGSKEGEGLQVDHDPSRGPRRPCRALAARTPADYLAKLLAASRSKSAYKP